MKCNASPSAVKLLLPLSRPSCCSFRSAILSSLFYFVFMTLLSHNVDILDQRVRGGTGDEFVSARERRVGSAGLVRTGLYSLPRRYPTLDVMTPRSVVTFGEETAIVWQTSYTLLSLQPMSDVLWRLLTW